MRPAKAHSPVIAAKPSFGHLDVWTSDIWVSGRDLNVWTTLTILLRLITVPQEREYPLWDNRNMSYSSYHITLQSTIVIFTPLQPVYLLTPGPPCSLLFVHPLPLVHPYTASYELLYATVSMGTGQSRAAGSTARHTCRLVLTQ